MPPSKTPAPLPTVPVWWPDVVLPVLPALSKRLRLPCLRLLAMMRCMRFSWRFLMRLLSRAGSSAAEATPQTVTNTAAHHPTLHHTTPRHTTPRHTI